MVPGQGVLVSLASLASARAEVKNVPREARLHNQKTRTVWIVAEYYCYYYILYVQLQSSSAELQSAISGG